MTGSQIDYYLKWLPLVEGRRHYGTAELMAGVFNAMGGKRKKERQEGDEPPLEPHELFKPEEFLPFFAWVTPPEDRVAPPEAQALIEAHLHELPSWVRSLA